LFEGRHGIIVMGGYEDYVRFAACMARHFDSRCTGHLYIEEQDVGSVAVEGFDGFQSVCCFGADTQFRPESAQSLADSARNIGSSSAMTAVGVMAGIRV